MSAKMQTRSDSHIQQDVLRELKWDTRVEETDIGLTVQLGVVSLTGTVSSYAKKLAAQEAAHRVCGVLDVVNDIDVKAPGGMARTDTEIEGAVRHAFNWDVWVPDERITSTVSNGWVTLEGDVDLSVEREDAQRGVRHLAGLCGVINKIKVTGPIVDPETVRETIEEALERRAQREANRIKVEVTNGVVTLSGRVHSWAEKQAVLGAVSHAPGVRVVQEHLSVDPMS